MGGNSPKEFPGAPAQPLEEVAWEKGGGLDPTFFRLLCRVERVCVCVCVYFVYFDLTFGEGLDMRTCWRIPLEGPGSSAT